MKGNTLIKYVGPPLILALGVASFVVLLKTRTEVAKADPEAKVTLVDAMTATKGIHQVSVVGQGSVMAAQQVMLQTEISGRVVEMNENLVSGGLLKKGDTVLKIDPKDYRLSLSQLNANVQRARFEVEIEEGRQVIAEREWELLGKDVPTTERGRALALRKPHARSAKASLASARSAALQAARNLDRTTLTVPFNAMVLNENADIGMLASPQSPVATLVGTDVYWVQVSLSYDLLPQLSIPGVNAKEGEGSRAVVTHKAGPISTTYEGRLLRLLGDMDPVGRLARVVVEVKDPLGLERSDKGFPLLLGAFVQVAFKGTQLQGVVEIPRLAVRADEKVWVVGKDNTLEERTIEVAWRTEDKVVVAKGLSGGEQVIISRLSGGVKGMAVRVDDGVLKASAPKDAKKEGKP